MIRYDVIGLAETRRRHPFNAVYDTGEELFLGTCDSRGVGGVGVLVKTSLRLKKCGSTPALTIFVVYAPTSNCDEGEVEAFYMDLERFYREDHTFFKIIIGDFNAKIGPRRSSEERHIGTHGLEWNEQGRPPTRWSEFLTKSVEERYDARRVPKASKTHWVTLARDRNGGFTGYRSSHSTINETTGETIAAIAIISRQYAEE
uniref:Endo/exonuclease/phosphatase domain-containing protein n=1 Tax=Angiostrongylus cantonensis TaxID=6313 RepID=A0A158PA32_ANGCA